MTHTHGHTGLICVLGVVLRCLEVHVGPEAVLVAVHLAAHGAQGLGGGALVIVVAGDVDTQAVLILHLPPALRAPEPLARAAHPETRSCNNRVE